MMLSKNFIVFFTIVILYTLTSHALMGRLAKRPYSRQAALIFLVFGMNVPLAVGCYVFMLMERQSHMIAWWTWAYSAVTFNSLMYAYFHVFNMSETGRRVRMLIEIQDKNGLEPHELKKSYSPDVMIRARLARLLEAHQVTLDAKGRYKVRIPFLLWVDFVLGFIRRVLGFKAHHE